MKACIPLAVLLVVDDLGWWNGEDGSLRGEPFRSGIPRAHTVDDYRALVELGRRLGSRIVGAFVACEWDRTNLLREAPTCTWMGRGWDNSRWVGPWLDEAAQVLRDGREQVELALHGVGHEYWDEQGRMSRAEFADMACRPRPAEQIRIHLEMFARILDQNGLGPMPMTYAPPAGRHGFGGEFSAATEQMRRAGIRQIITPFATMRFNERTQHERLGVDGGVATLERGWDHWPWMDMDAAGDRPISAPVCGLHWANVLHPDPARNLEAVERWASLLLPLNGRLDRKLARDTGECLTQAVYHDLTTLRFVDGRLEMNFGSVDRLGMPGARRRFELKVECGAGGAWTAEGVRVCSSVRDEARGVEVLELERVSGSRSARLWR